MAVRVNGETVSEDAVRLEYQRLLAFHREHLPATDIDSVRPQLMRKAWDQAIGSVLLIHEARRRRIRVTPEAVEDRFRGMIESCGGKEPFTRMLQSKSLDLEMVRAAVVSGLQVDELVREITADVAEPTDRDLQDYHDQHQDGFLMPEKVRARHLLLKLDSDSEADRAVAEARLEGLAAQVADGTAFADLATVHSECPSGREAGGLIGWIGRGTVLPAIDAAVFALEDNGAVSPPVLTPLGLHLFQRIDHQPARPARFDEARDRIAELLRHVRRGERITAFVAQLRQTAVIETDGTPDLSTDG